MQKKYRVRTINVGGLIDWTQRFVPLNESSVKAVWDRDTTKRLLSIGSNFRCIRTWADFTRGTLR